MDSAGLIYDHSPHYIDHLAPFCALKGWPLIVCEPSIEESIQSYYPDVKVLYMDRFNLQLPPTIVSCDTKAGLRSALQLAENIHLLWLPHGNSDKGWKAPFFEALNQNDTALVYGQKMIDFMHKKNTFPQTIKIGNFRKEYWLKHQTFYQTILSQKISLPRNLKTYLYAPTWKDGEDNSSFEPLFPALAEHLPPSCSLIVKIHPNTYVKNPSQIEQIMGRFSTHKNIFFLTDFPPIYPLLNLCDAYIGDMSSIGYDFLTFDREMFFMNTKRLNPKEDPTLFLHSCGISILPEEIGGIFSMKTQLFTEIRKRVYDYTFS